VSTFPLTYGITLPDWVAEQCRAFGSGPHPDPVRRLELVLALARHNFERQTGGPFAAAVYRADTFELVAAGVNRVVPESCSSAHAEIVALSLAQAHRGAFDLGSANMPPHELVVSWRPCAMCFGALPWSGIRSLLIAGSGDELEQLTGFDEGPIHPAWRDELTQRGISVTQGATQAEAVAVFRDFAASGAVVYNGRRGG
jgi:tRNA(Arg) A34 adenosine deaminase TadA